MDWLFSTDGFVAKRDCGDGWTDTMLSAYVASNGVAFLVYQAFPVLMILYLYPRHLKSVRPALRALMLFISTCGLTHLAEMLTATWPVYRLVVAVNCLNVATSILGLVLLVRAIEAIRFVPVRSVLENEVESLRDKFKDIQMDANRIADVDPDDAIARLRRLGAELVAMRRKF